MDLTWVAAGSVLLLGTGYAFVRRAGRFRVVCWSLLCAALFALATRDLFRQRERDRPTGRAGERPAGQANERTHNRAGARRGRTDTRGRERASNRAAGETASPLVARLRRRFARWLD